jgi:hypothetical protein
VPITTHGRLLTTYDRILKDYRTNDCVVRYYVDTPVRISIIKVFDPDGNLVHVRPVNGAYTRLRELLKFNLANYYSSVDFKPLSRHPYLDIEIFGFSYVEVERKRAEEKVSWQREGF